MGGQVEGVVVISGLVFEGDVGPVGDGHPCLQEGVGDLETIPRALYEYLAARPDFGQVIIADNTKFMPNLDDLTDSCNLIRFSKREDEGRYGFLVGFTNATLVNEEHANDEGD